MLCNNALKLIQIFLMFKHLHADKLLIQILIKSVALIKYISDTAAHTGSKVFACLSQYDYRTSGHIFTAMLADTLNYCCCTGIPYGKSFPGLTCYIRLS